MTAPAYLYTGPDGSEAEAVALAFASQLLGNSEKVARGNHPDFLKIEPEKDSIKIEAVREAAKRLSLQPHEGEHVVILIREAEAMTEGAANALLKTLEEPPEFATFILTTSVPDRLPATIRSRCRRVGFAEPPLTALHERFAELHAEHQELLQKLLQKSSFSLATELAEETAGDPGKIDETLQLLKGWWHDLVVYDQTREERFLLFPKTSQLLPWLEGRSTTRLFENLDLMEESERALEGNVNKTLLLERLFSRLMV